jgi:hemoglobin
MSLVQRSSAAQNRQGWVRFFASRTFAAGILSLAVLGLGVVGTGCKHADNGSGSSGSGSSDQYAGTLYARLGEEKGITKVVDDFVQLAASDQKVNFTRMNPPHPHTWDPGADDNMKKLKKHLVQFISKVAGGPQEYDGKDMVTVHKGMEITDAEFGAIAADLQQAMAQNGVAEADQKSVLDAVGGLKDQIVGH